MTMGMFDYVRVEGHELPGLDRRLVEESRNESLAKVPTVFQTKDMDNCLGVYIIKGGRLFERIYETEKAPEEERNRRAEEGPSSPRPRLTRTGRHEGRDLDYHGDLRFYALKNELGLTEERGSGLMEFRARFTHGDLEWIKLVVNDR